MLESESLRDYDQMTTKREALDVFLFAQMRQRLRAPKESFGNLRTTSERMNISDTEPYWFLEAPFTQFRDGDKFQASRRILYAGVTFQR